MRWAASPLDGHPAHGSHQLAGLCIPARRSLATGHYPHNTGIWRNRTTQLDPEAPNWIRAVREAGYRTSLFGKTHLNHAGHDLRTRAPLLTAQGIDDVYETVGPRQSARTLSHMTAEWESLGIWDAYQRDLAERFASKPHLVRPSPLGFEHYYDTHVGQKAKAYLEAYDRDQPWFCWVSFGGPHEPWDTPEPYFSHYDPEQMPPALSGDLRAGDRPRGQLDALFARMPALTPADVAALRANYAGNVSLIDDQIGQLFSVIERRGEWQNTVVVLCSDHGEMNGDYGLIYKGNFLNSAVRVPLLVKGPAVARGVCEAPVEWFDVGPTLAEFAGAELDFAQFAVSLMASLRDPGVATRSEALSEIYQEVMVMDARWKCVVNAAGRVYLLFDLENDPNESTNLAGMPERHAVEERLRLRILERLMAAQFA